jgi:hypothetical protein
LLRERITIIVITIIITNHLHIHNHFLHTMGAAVCNHFHELVHLQRKDFLSTLFTTMPHFLSISALFRGPQIDLRFSLIGWLSQSGLRICLMLAALRWVIFTKLISFHCSC